MSRIALAKLVIIMASVPSVVNTWDGGRTDLQRMQIPSGCPQNCPAGWEPFFSAQGSWPQKNPLKISFPLLFKMGKKSLDKFANAIVR